MTAPAHDPNTFLISPQMSAYIDQAAKKAAREVMAEAIGVDLSSYESLREHHADQMWLRNTRLGSGKIRWIITTASIGSIVSGLSFFIYSVFQRGGQ